jgi:hypothetical protein
MRLFFYGTLLDADVQALVLGRSLAAELVAAELRHFRRVYIAGRLYPMVLPHRGGTVEGAFTETLSKDERTRIAIYEGSDYRLERQSVYLLAENDAAAAGPVPVWLHRSRSTTRPSTREWRLPAWQAKEKAVYLRDTRLWLASQSEILSR